MCTDSIYKKWDYCGLNIGKCSLFFVISPVHTDILRFVPQLPEYLKHFCSVNKENETTKLSVEHQTPNADFRFFDNSRQSVFQSPLCVSQRLMLYSSFIYSFTFFFFGFGIQNEFAFWNSEYLCERCIESSWKSCNSISNSFYMGASNHAAYFCLVDRIYFDRVNGNITDTSHLQTRTFSNASFTPKPENMCNKFRLTTTKLEE